MPITKSAQKALRQSKKRRVANLRRSKDYKLSFKEFRKLVELKSKNAAGFLPKLYKALDKAAKTDVIKKNKAARLKSKAAKLLVK